MHSYLRSIGFSDIKNRRQLTPITKEIIAYPTTRNIITVDADTRLVQLTKDFGEGFGISLVGEMDIDNTVSILLSLCSQFFRNESGTHLYRKARR